MPSTGMLGAIIGQLEDVAGQWIGGGELAFNEGLFVQNTVNAAVADLQASSQQAQAQVVAAVTNIRQTIAQVRTALDSAEWTGQNALLARGTGADVDARVQQVTAEIEQLFNDFNQSIFQLGADLTDRTAQFNNETVVEAERSEQLGRAVDEQARALDAVMNTGLQI